MGFSVVKTGVGYGTEIEMERPIYTRYQRWQLKRRETPDQTIFVGNHGLLIRYNESHKQNTVRDDPRGVELSSGSSTSLPVRVLIYLKQES